MPRVELEVGSWQLNVGSSVFHSSLRPLRASAVNTPSPCAKCVKFPNEPTARRKAPQSATSKSAGGKTNRYDTGPVKGA
jgi:hypothetical protein